MANHAWVYGCKKRWNTDDIQRLAETFCQTILKGLFHVTRSRNEKEGRDYFLIVCNKDELLSLQFWTSTHKRSRAIEIRHSINGDFMWWLDFNWENYLSWHLEGKIEDDGGGPTYEAREELKYPSVSDWVAASWPKYQRIGKWLGWLSMGGEWAYLRTAFWEDQPERPTPEELASLNLPPTTGNEG